MILQGMNSVGGDYMIAVDHIDKTDDLPDICRHEPLCIGRECVVKPSQNIG